MVALPDRRRALSPRAQLGLVRVLERPTFELIPLRNVHGEIGSLPAGAEVSVTASPAKGLEATIALAIELQAAGFRAVPHVAARMVHDRAHLRDLLARMADGGVQRAFVVGGDAVAPGAFPDGLSLLREIAEMGSRSPLDIGIPCYPDGHAFLPDAVLLDALRAKAPFASYMTTQLCFDAAAIASWVSSRRAEGMTLPVVLGVPGVTEPHRLLAISARIGVRDSRRFLVKNVGFVARLARSGGFYRPDGLLRSLAPLIADPRAVVRGLHLYTFNQVAATESWRQSSLRRLEPASAHAGDWQPARRGAGWLTRGDR